MAALPEILLFVPDGVPDELKALKRWAPWEAIWSEKRQKFDKVPRQPNGYGLSTAKPERWFTWEVAEAAVRNNPTRFAGVGFVMTGIEDLTGVDLDNCVENGRIAPWAQEVVAQMGSYTEFSPSGVGLRIWALGKSPTDWTNHERGIEVYSGHEPRFLTVTGCRLPEAPKTPSRPDPAVLAAIASQHAREKTSAQVIDLNLPEILDELVLPDVADLDLPYRVKDFLTDGTTGEKDRSTLVAHAAVALYSLGLSDAEVFSLLCNNVHCMEMALDHRNQDADRARAYLWRWHCVAGKPKASNRVAQASDFEDTSARPAAALEPGASDYDDMPPAPGVEEKWRFQAFQARKFVTNRPMRWLVKRVLPQAEVGVVYGASKAGKSFFVLDLACHIAQGMPWRERKVAQGAVVYVCAEGAHGFETRVAAQAEYLGVPLEDLNLHIIREVPSLMDAAQLKLLVASIRRIPGVSLVVIDTFAQATAGANENSGEDMGRAMSNCRKLNAALGAMVLLVGHSGKDEDRGMRGWSGVLGALDVEINVQRAGDDRVAEITKMKDGPGEGDQYGFKLEVVNVGVDEDGDPVTTCVAHAAVVTKPVRSNSAAERTSLQEAAILEALAQDVAGQGMLQPEIMAYVMSTTPVPAGRNDTRGAAFVRNLAKMVQDGRLRITGNRVFLGG